MNNSLEMIGDYVRSLEYENNTLRSDFEAQAQLTKNYKKRIQEAIEYIKTHKLYEFKEDDSNWFEYIEDTKAKQKLLEILGDKE